MHDKASRAADLEKKNAELKVQQQTYASLNQVLKSEIDQKQVMIEQLANRSVKVTLQNAVLFSSGEFALNKGGKRILDKLVPALREQEGKSLVRIVGHTDNNPVNSNRQAFIDNWDLSARRAADVVRYFVWAQKLPISSFRVEGRAYVEPVASNETPEGQAKNRRIEIFIEQL